MQSMLGSFRERNLISGLWGLGVKLNFSGSKTILDRVLATLGDMESCVDAGCLVGVAPSAISAKRYITCAALERGMSRNHSVIAPCTSCSLSAQSHAVIDLSLGRNFKVASFEPVLVCLTGFVFNDRRSGVSVTIDLLIGLRKIQQLAEEYLKPGCTVLIRGLLSRLRSFVTKGLRHFVYVERRALTKTSKSIGT
jgi:hypothetical protein